MPEESEKEPFVPHVPAESRLPEMTVKAVLLGVLLSIVLAGANAYLGLKVGMTVSASIPAAVISMGVLRLFRRSNILENNLVQTAASAGESLAAGVIFTLPALLLLGYWKDFHYAELTSIALLGGILGVLFSIPLRRALILEGKLTFPEGLATAEVLKVGEQGGKGVRLIAIAGVVGALVKLWQSGFKIVSASFGTAMSGGKLLLPFGIDYSLALIAVGVIVRLRIAVLVFLGGIIAWFLGIPIYYAQFGAPEGVTSEGYELAFAIWNAKIRYMGVGAMVVGGIWALVSMLGPLQRGIRASMQSHSKYAGDAATAVPRTEKDLPFPLVVISTLVLVVPLFFVLRGVVDAEALGISAGTGWAVVLVSLALSVVAGFLFSAVAGYMAGLVGSSNNPISGITIATILSTSLLLLALIGLNPGDETKGIAAAAVAILVGGVVCCAAAISGDNLQDLKSGHLVGGTPFKQQIMQIVGVTSAALIMAPVLSLLFNAYGLGGHFPREGMDVQEALKAPQATLMQSVAQGVFSQKLEWGMIQVGALIAVLVIVMDQVLRVRGSTFRMPVLAVAVGIYLPLELSVPIFLGGLVVHLAGRVMKARGDRNPEHSHRNGLLFASGLIAGEAIIGILLAIPFAIHKSTKVLELNFAGKAMLANSLGVIVLLGALAWIYQKIVRIDDEESA